MFLDLEKVLVSDVKNKNAAKILQKINELKTLLEQNKEFITKTDTIFNQHRYNDKKLHFTKLENYKNLQIVRKLSASAVKVLFYLCCLMSQQNLVAVKIRETSKELQMSTVTFNKSLKELETHGCISMIYQSKKNNVGTIYMINTKICNSSKYCLDDEFEKITSNSQLMNFSILNRCEYDVITSKTSLNDNLIIYNSSELHNNNNIKKQKNQQNIVTTNNFETDDEELNEIFGE